MKKAFNNFMANLGKVFASQFFWSFPTFFYYRWFIQPLSSVFKDITFMQAFGLTLIISLIKSRYHYADGILKKNTTKLNILTAMYYLFFGFIVHAVISIYNLF